MPKTDLHSVRTPHVDLHSVGEKKTRKKSRKQKKSIFFCTVNRFSTHCIILAATSGGGGAHKYLCWFHKRIEEWFVQTAYIWLSCGFYAGSRCCYYFGVGSHFAPIELFVFEFRLDSFVLFFSLPVRDMCALLSFVFVVDAAFCHFRLPFSLFFSFPRRSRSPAFFLHIYFLTGLLPHVG